MKITAIQSLKGGTGKSVTAANLAHILAVYHGKKVLLVDCDMQGNTAQYYGLYDDGRRGTADILTMPNMDINEVIFKTDYAGLDVITANMNLYEAERKAYATGDYFILKNALQSVAHEYDYCIIDDAPAFNMAVVSALIAADNIIIPLRVDDFSKEGLKSLNEQINNAKQVNNALHVKGCLTTHWQNNNVNIQGEEYIKKEINLPFFNSHIRYSSKIAESTFCKKPLAAINNRSGATIDYKRFAKEYLSESDS